MLWNSVHGFWCICPWILFLPLRFCLPSLPIALLAPSSGLIKFFLLLLTYFYLFISNRFYFLFYLSRFTTKLTRKDRHFPYIPCPHTCIVSPIINIPHQSGTSANNWLTYIDTSLSPKLYSGSLLMLYFGFEKAYNVYKPLEYHTE